MPASQMHYAATCGFYEPGIEVEHFDSHSDAQFDAAIPEKSVLEDPDAWLRYEKKKPFADLAPDVGVFGYITDVWAALDRVRRPHPPSIDYPMVLNRLLGRVVGRTCLGRVRSTAVPTFVKPVQHKLFTGFVHYGDGESRMRVVTQPDSTEVWTSEVVQFRSEYRVFVLGDEILDVRRYRGDWNYVPAGNVVHSAVQAWEGRGQASGVLPRFRRDGR